MQKPLLLLTLAALSCSTTHEKKSQALPPGIATPSEISVVPFQVKNNDVKECLDASGEIDLSKIRRGMQNLSEFLDRLPVLPVVEQYAFFEQIVRNGAIPGREFRVDGIGEPIVIPQNTKGYESEAIVSKTAQKLARSTLSFVKNANCSKLYKGSGVQGLSESEIEARVSDLHQRNRLIYRGLRSVRNIVNDAKRATQILSEMFTSMCLNLESCRSASLIVYEAVQYPFTDIGILIDADFVLVRSSYPEDGCLAGSPLLPLCGPGNDINEGICFKEQECMPLSTMAEQFRQRKGKTGYNEVVIDIAQDAVLGLAVSHSEEEEITERITWLHEISKEVKNSIGWDLPVFVVLPRKKDNVMLAETYLQKLREPR